MERRIHVIALAGLALCMVCGPARADKGEIKNIGFDMHFTEHPSENPDVVEIYEGDTVKVVLHQSNVFGKEGLELPDKEDIESDGAYFIYPGNGCAQECLSMERLKPSEIWPFAQTYYVLAPQMIGQNTRVVLMDQALVMGEKITDALGQPSKPSKPASTPSYQDPLPTMDDDADPSGDEDGGEPLPPHPGVPTDDECGDPDHPCVEAVPLDAMWDFASDPGFAPVSWAVTPVPMQAYPDPVKGLKDSFLRRYYDQCADQTHVLSYRYWYVNAEGGIQEALGSIVIPPYEGYEPVEKWFARIVEANNQDNSSDHVQVSYVGGRILLMGRKVGKETLWTGSEGLLPENTVVHIRVETRMNPCEGAFLGFLPTNTYSFPYTSTMPSHVYEHKKYAQVRSSVCEVDQALTDAIRPRLPSDEHQVLKCPFEKKAVMAGPFWAFLTTQQVYKKKKSTHVDILVKGDPIIVMSNGQSIVNVEARISYDGSAAETESFSSPTLETPIYYYLIKDAKPGVYAITPVVNIEDPWGGTGEPQQMPGRVILVKVKTREAYSMIRLQIGIIAYSELRAMAFTALITPVLNPKSFFKRKFLPAPYPMPHIGLRLGSQDDIIGLQVGLGIALLKEFIIVGGLQFGTQDLTSPWDWRKAWYIGVAIDPWLLQKSIALSAKSE